MEFSNWVVALVDGRLYTLAAETIDLGGATIKSDGSGALTIAATGAHFPQE